MPTRGFTITIDGPASLFKASTRYGVDIAKLIPAILHVSRWRLTATLQLKDNFANQPKTSTVQPRQQLRSGHPLPPPVNPTTA